MPSEFYVKLIVETRRQKQDHCFYGKINIFPSNQRFTKDLLKELISRKFLSVIAFFTLYFILDLECLVIHDFYIFFFFFIVTIISSTAIT